MSENYAIFEKISEKATLRNISIFRKIFSKFKNKKILDLGGGSGVFSNILDSSNSYFLLDSDKYSIVKARIKGIKGIVSDAEKKLPYKNSFFDVVICKDVFEHLVLPEKTLLEIKRVLKSKGLLVAHVPNEYTILDRFCFLFGKSIIKKRWFPETNVWDYPHLRFFTISSFRQFLEKNDFLILNDFSSEYSFKGLKFLSKLSPSLFSSGITFVCQKK